MKTHMNPDRTVVSVLDSTYIGSGVTILTICAKYVGNMNNHPGHRAG